MKKFICVSLFASYLFCFSCVNDISGVCGGGVTLSLCGRYTVVPDKDPDNNVTAGCTGLGYNPDTDEFVISYYNYAEKSELWIYSKADLTSYAVNLSLNPNPTRKIDVSKYVAHIQGCDYDTDLKCYWLIGTIPGEDLADDKRLMIQISTEGKLIGRFEMFEYTYQPGMLAVYGDEIYIKPNNKKLIWVFNKTDKKLIRTINTPKYQHEGFGLDKTNGDIWLISDNMEVDHYDNDMNLIGNYRIKTFNNQVEGVIISAETNRMFVTADSYLHGNINNGNCLWEYLLPAK